MKRPRQQFAELLGGKPVLTPATMIAWNWFRVGVKHGGGKRIPRTDYNYLQSMMASALVQWKRFKP